VLFSAGPGHAAAKSPIDVAVVSGPVFVDAEEVLAITASEPGAVLGDLTLAISSEGVTRSIPVRQVLPQQYQAHFFPTSLASYTYEISGQVNGEPFHFTEQCGQSTYLIPCPVNKSEYAVPYPHKTLNDLLYDRPGADMALVRTLQNKLNVSTVLSAVALGAGSLGLVVGFDAYRRVRATKLDVLYEDLQL
jgi:hypothetical protein